MKKLLTLLSFILICYSASSQTKLENYVGTYYRSGGMFAAEITYKLVIEKKDGCLIMNEIVESPYDDLDYGYDEEELEETEDESEEEVVEENKNNGPSGILLKCKWVEDNGIKKLLIYEPDTEYPVDYELDENGNVWYLSVLMANYERYDN